MITQNSDPLHWLAVIRLPEIGPISIGRWLTMHSNIASLFTATNTDLTNAGFKPKQIASLKQVNWPAATRDLQWCEKNHCHLITLYDERYPPMLKEIHGAPPVLFAQGDINLLKEPQLAIVGSRHPTETGKEIAKQFAYQLTQSGLYIISGLALGIDAASHQGALQANGKTLAVLGNGLKMCYPASHRQLADKIRSNGLLISEFPPDEPPHARHFPRRNRIISGLSKGTLVIEAALRSGSLISARYALEQGREVFAIPGSIHNPLARGCHQLIRQGAKLVETAKDIFDELGITPKEMPIIKKECRIKKKLPAKMRTFLAQIGHEATSFDTIMLRSGLTAGEVSSMLLSLELQGYVQNVHGSYQLTID